MNEIYVPNTFRRLMARIIDQLFCLIFYIPVMKTFYLLVFTDEEVQVSLVLLILFGLIPALYEGLWLWLLQQTPGKWFLGLKVVDLYNPERPLIWTQCLMRALVGRFELIFSLALYATAFFRYDRTHIADWLAETRVVQFHPRQKRAQIRWILGSILVICYGAQGLMQTAQVLRGMKIENGQVSLRSLYKTPTLPLENEDSEE